MAERILVADDEKEIRNLLRLYLENEGFEVYEASSGPEVLSGIRTKQPDLLLLDIMMPEMDGLSVLKEIRKTHNIPVIIISARTGDAEKILGLNIGADDYICKPFNPLEVVARVRSQLRRSRNFSSGENSEESKTITAGNLSLDTDKCILTVDGEQVELTSVEYRIMELLMSHPGKVFTKQQIYEYAWKEEYFVSDNNIMVAISKLRTKLSEDPSRYIKTMRGLGYRLDAR